MQMYPNVQKERSGRKQWKRSLKSKVDDTVIEPLSYTRRQESVKVGN